MPFSAGLCCALALFLLHSHFSLPHLLHCHPYQTTGALLILYTEGLWLFSFHLPYLVINPTLLSLPRYLVAPLLASSFWLCWSPTFGGQHLPCSCSSWAPPPASARGSQCSLQTSPCPLQNKGACWAYLLLCFLLFQLSPNCGIVPCFVIRLRSWANFPGVPHWKCLKNKSN